MNPIVRLRWRTRSAARSCCNTRHEPIYNKCESICWHLKQRCCCCCCSIDPKISLPSDPKIAALKLANGILEEPSQPCSCNNTLFDVILHYSDLLRAPPIISNFNSLWTQLCASFERGAFRLAAAVSHRLIIGSAVWGRLGEERSIIKRIINKHKYFQLIWIRISVVPQTDAK